MPLSVEGKFYTIKGIGQIKLFPIAKLSQALTDADIPRDTQTLRKWETKGIIPPAIFRGGNKRLYSLPQIECIVSVAKECNIKKGVSISQTDFVTRVWEELEKLNSDYISRMKQAQKK